VNNNFKLEPKRIRIISVAGATSRAGKTLLAEQIIQYLSGHKIPVYAVKFTTTSDLPSPCPRGAPCTVCDLSDRFRIVRDPSILMQPGKNTQRLAAAGATEVVWIIARKSSLAEAYKHLLEHLPNDAITVMEGSTITTICKPDLVFYVAANHIPPAKWKDNAKEILNSADFIILNKKKGTIDHPQIQIPKSAISLNLRETSVTEIGKVRSELDRLTGSEKKLHTSIKKELC
jgi:hypothetical protein